MQRVFGSISQAVVMAAIVTTLLCVPLAALLALLSFALLGIPAHAFVTFGESLGAFQGVVAWWSICFLPALTYAVCVLPWSPRQ
jgi:hypothetical protein